MAYFDFTGLDDSIYQYIRYYLGKKRRDATKKDMFNAVSSGIRKFLIDIDIQTQQRYRDRDAKRLYYISMEFLTGRLLASNLINLGIYEKCRRYLAGLGWDLDELVEEEPHPALGNGGLGRLAACFLDSLAGMDMPGFGYGINYDYGLFKQLIVNGYQKEAPDYWPNRSSPWLIGRFGEKCMVPVYGRIVDTKDTNGDYNPVWHDWQLIVGRSHDVLVSGYGGRTVNRLRLFSAWASTSFDIRIFNDGDYFKAVEDKIKSETISKILYPSDSKESGKELRLIQEYFLVSCSVQDIIRIFLKDHDDFEIFPEKVAIQLNDTHPALTVAELMRSLIDQHGVEWEKAWEITTATLGYTNHTLLPEALEKWPLAVVEKVIPRHLQLIYEINARFLGSVEKRYPGDKDLLERLSIVEEGTEKQIRMAHLAIIGSHSVNGVSKVHSKLVTEQLVPDFYQISPEKFNNKTNGVTPRRWLYAANQGLSGLLCETLGDAWVQDLERIADIEEHKYDRQFLDHLGRIKRENKERLGRFIKEKCYVDVNPDSIFDIQIKRIHEYKRQLLNLMNIIHMYLAIKEDGITPENPRTFIFAGKAAPGYFIAKLIIKLVHSLGEVINKDPVAGKWLKVAFIPDYRVSLAEKIIPAADVSEQISTAGMEASGTGNMKLAMNGAVTIGTLDGANVEIRDEVGEENIYIFGLTVDEVQKARADYDADTWLERSPSLQRVMDALNSNMFCEKESGLFKPFYENLVHRYDHYLHLADFESYKKQQEAITADYSKRDAWNTRSLLNIARTGRFSSDRTVREYAEHIWNIESCK